MNCPMEKEIQYNLTGTGATGAATGGTGTWAGGSAAALAFLALPALAPPCGCDFLTLLACPA